MCVGGWVGSGVFNGWILWHEMSSPFSGGKKKNIFQNYRLLKLLREW